MKTETAEEEVVVEFYEHGSLRERGNPYELRVVARRGDRELCDIPYVDRNPRVIERIGEEVALILESRGLENIDVLIDPINRNGLKLLQVEGFEFLVLEALKKHHHRGIKIKTWEKE